MKTKRCTKCGEVKSLEKFGKHPECREGRGGRCKDCINKYQNKLRRERRSNEPGYREKLNKQGLKRYHERCCTEPEYRKKLNKKQRKRRANDPGYRDRQKKYERERTANDPEYRERKKKRTLKSYKKRSADPECRKKMTEKHMKRHHERMKNDPEYKKRVDKYFRDQPKNLKKNYIKGIIKYKYKIPRKLIDDEMVERERELIKINRLFRRQSNAGTKKIN